MGRDDVSATWVLEQFLPKEVIQECERGIEVEVSVDKAVQTGQKTYTATETTKS